MILRNAAYWARVVSHTLVLVLLIALSDICLMGALVVKLFSPKLGWRISCWTADWFWGYMQTHFERTRNAGPVIKVTGDELPAGEAAILLMNHLSYADFYLTQHLAVKAGMLGNCRYFAKQELVWMIPLFGWAFWDHRASPSEDMEAHVQAMDMILVSRNWTKDEHSIQNAFHRLTSHNHRAWIGLCPEGTRLSPRKLLTSRAFSRQHDKPELRHLLWPRAKGFVATVKGMRGQVEAVYDLSYVYVTPGRQKQGGTAHEMEKTGGRGEKTDSRGGVCGRSARVPSLAELVGTGDLAREGYEFFIHVRRIPIADLPVTDDALRQWCEDRWVEKEQIIHQMLIDAGVAMTEVDGVLSDEESKKESVERTK